MVTDDPVREALRALGRPSSPPPKFRDDLLQRLLREGGGRRTADRRLRARRGLAALSTVTGWAAVAAVVVALLGGLYLVVMSRGAEVPATVQEGREAFTGLPSFRAVVRSRLPAEEIAGEYPDYTGGDGMLVHEISYADGRWRRELVSREPADIPVGSGPGSFMVWDGRLLGVYSADENVFYFQPTAAGFDPADELSFYDPESRWATTCPGAEAVARSRLLGREAVQVPCGDEELWIDLETGLILRRVFSDGYEQMVELEIGASFPAGTFEVAAPEGAEGPDESPDEGAPTALEPGERAPAWTGPLLDGGTFRLEDLRGRPALVFFWADWCDDACFGRFPTYARLLAEWSDRLGFVSVDYLGAADRAALAMRREDATFAVVVDEDGAVGEAWGIRAVPTWVILDAEGRVVAVRTGVQTHEALSSLLARAEDGAG